MDTKDTFTTKIEYPELETVVDDKNNTAKPGFGRTRFTKLAAKVITKIYETPPEEAPSKESETDETEECSKTNANRQTPKQTDQPPKKSNNGRLKVPKSKNSFASLIRLAKYKRMVSKTPSDSASQEKPADEPVAMPRKPRFSATMSPEAQYAMLKGYEDLLLTTLKTEQPKPVPSNEGHLVRVKTPHHSIVSVHLNGLESRSGGGSTESFHSEESTKNKLHMWDIRPAPYQGQMYKLVAKDDSTGGSSSRRQEDTSKALLPRRSITEFQDKLVPKDKQILLTHRFQCAMDILDEVREDRGQVVTSPRHRKQKKHPLNPVDNYNSWSREWSREFKLEFTK